MAFTPLHDRVVVRRLEEDENEVVSVGAGARDEDGDRIDMDVKAGDKVLFGKWSGTEIRLAGEDLLIMKESDILGIIA
jgi:chaperonin GroES